MKTMKKSIFGVLIISMILLLSPPGVAAPDNPCKHSCELSPSDLGVAPASVTVNSVAFACYQFENITLCAENSFVEMPTGVGKTYRTFLYDKLNYSSTYPNLTINYDLFRYSVLLKNKVTDKTVNYLSYPRTVRILSKNSNFNYSKLNNLHSERLVTHLNFPRTVRILIPAQATC